MRQDGCRHIWCLKGYVYVFEPSRLQMMGEGVRTDHRVRAHRSIPTAKGQALYASGTSATEAVQRVQRKCSMRGPYGDALRQWLLLLSHRLLRRCSVEGSCLVVIESNGNALYNSVLETHTHGLHQIDSGVYILGLRTLRQRVGYGFVLPSFVNSSRQESSAEVPSFSFYGSVHTVDCCPGCDAQAPAACKEHQRQGQG